MEDLTRKEEQILLAVFSLKRKAYLITIREQIKEYTGKYYSVGTIYAPLNRLHLNGYLETYTDKCVDSSSTKPIKFYKLTQRGYDSLVQLQRQTNKMWSGFSSPVYEKQ